MKHLTQAERYQIAAQIQNGCSQRVIAKDIGVSPSTISRECSRNRCHDGLYRAQAAQEKSTYRRHQASSHKQHTGQVIDALLRKVTHDGWTPECAVNRLKRETGMWISHQTLYNRLHEMGKGYVRFVRRYRRRHTIERRGQIPDRTGLSARPAIAHRRHRRGDLEADTMLGQQRGGHAVAVVSDRKTRYTFLRYMNTRSAEQMNECIARIVSCCPSRPYTLTLDNGKEFSRHQLLQQRTGLRCYFTDTYCAWQKGTVENIIGVLRRWLPKGSDFSSLTPQRLAKIQRWFNNRPMAVLDYKTPFEVYNSSHTVAFHF